MTPDAQGDDPIRGPQPPQFDEQGKPIAPQPQLDLATQPIRPEPIADGRAKIHPLATQPLGLKFPPAMRPGKA